MVDNAEVLTKSPLQLGFIVLKTILLYVVFIRGLLRFKLNTPITKLIIGFIMCTTVILTYEMDTLNDIRVLFFVLVVVNLF
jgi:hypothetical protein